MRESNILQGDEVEKEVGDGWKLFIRGWSPFNQERLEYHIMSAIAWILVRLRRRPPRRELGATLVVGEAAGAAFCCGRLFWMKYKTKTAFYLPATTSIMPDKKKRKLESAPTEIRKKLKPIDQTEESAGEENEKEKASPTEETGPSPDIAIVPAANAATENPLPLPAQATASTKQQEAPQAIDEDEWAAFERFVAAPTRIQVPAAVLNSGATICAAPVSAAELAKHESTA
ncbi:hypothetical protein CISG_05068 [Coccidioides immitis RMSCC 3703]|uniref:Uncharacterized protein n=1 Tax=Coccidioides immitis RMSCC 3703 TaxID=454286 RepID=A0A0J8TNX6_COCIT|nr:hypothetical protein CISG_05068 [Coccidioides immitis RMSCC 3703]